MFLEEVRQGFVSEFLKAPALSPTQSDNRLPGLLIELDALADHWSLVPEAPEHPLCGQIQNKGALYHLSSNAFDTAKQSKRPQLDMVPASGSRVLVHGTDLNRLR